MKTNVYLLLGIIFLCTSVKCFGNKLTLAQIQKLKTSVVRVKTNSTNNIGTGFIHTGTKYVVTAFHVVSGSNGNVKIIYEALGQERDGKVVKTFKSADLALIEITNPINVPVLNSSTANVDYNSEYTAIGFLWDAKDYYPIDLIKKETRNLNYLPSKTKNDLISAGCPSLTLNVFSFAGNPLVPGFSGSPIFDSNEEIIAIGDGGIKEGLASVSWGIPVSNLTALFTSTQNDIGTVVLTKSLYAADDIQSSNWENDFLIINNEKFNKTRTEKLQSIAGTTDDVIGLNKILNSFPPQMDKSNIEFDVYQNFSNGAIFVLPSSYTYSQQGNTLELESSNGKAIFSIVIEHCNLPQLNPLTIKLEKYQLEQTQGWYWNINPSFTYTYPISRSDGFMVRRAAYIQSYYNQSQNYTYANNYLFESFVYKNNLLMYLSVKNSDYNTAYLNKAQSCFQNGYIGIDCTTKLAEQKEWMKMAVAVHFATFSK